MKRILLLLCLIHGVTSCLFAGNGFHVAFLGDSNTFIGGEDCSQPQGWNKWFCEELHPVSCRSYARSGATWTHTAKTRQTTTAYSELLHDDNVVSNQVQRLCDTCAAGLQPVPDLIIIMAGTNDAWFAKRRPHAFSADSTLGQQTLAGAVKQCCHQLREAFPRACIVLTTPLQTITTPLERIRSTGDIIEQCGREMGLHVVRLDSDSVINCAEEKICHHYTTDGTHTSVEGARHVGSLLAKESLKILNQHGIR